MKKNWIERLKTRWGLKSAFQVIIVLIVFALTGSTSVYITKPIFALIGVGTNSPLWLKIVLNILIILPIYQVLLLAYGFLFGQFHFFWEFEKKMFRGIARLFQSRS
ncbi:MAG: DUF6787 family protein [Bacteroidota bacterium]